MYTTNVAYCAAGIFYEAQAYFFILYSQKYLTHKTWTQKINPQNFQLYIYIYNINRIFHKFLVEFHYTLVSGKEHLD